MPDLKKQLLSIYQMLLDRYGPQGWWPAESKTEVIVGAILTQSTSWKNVEKALTNLKEAAVLDLKSLYNLSDRQLEKMIRPSGFYKVKTKRLKAFVEHLYRDHEGSLDSFLRQDLFTLRNELLSIYGVGPETADAIILYAAAKPIFVVDAYAHRLFSRLGLIDEGYDYRKMQFFFMGNLPQEVALFAEYHALIVCHSVTTCRKTPLCGRCAIVRMCCFGRSVLKLNGKD